MLIKKKFHDKHDQLYFHKLSHNNIFFQKRIYHILQAHAILFCQKILKFVICWLCDCFFIKIRKLKNFNCKLGYLL